MALTTDTSVLTAYANDYDFGGVFARQVEALGRAGDALVVVSTSGNSENLCRAVQAARARHVACLGVLGCGGGRLFTMLDAAVVVPGIDTCRIQEAHAAVIHVLCSLVEQEVFGAASSRPSMSVPR
jgi:D-sedoheptulose 7-phosphate isomerase